MKELTVISGKGGTGKTSVAASLAVLAEHCVVADCDVDAADLHLLLAPTATARHELRSGHRAVIRQEACNGCGECAALCRFAAVTVSAAADSATFSIDPIACEGCGVCVRFCPEHAIDFPERLCGEWMVSDTRCGPMVHARLAVAAENSGKLVSIVRREARRIAEEKAHALVVVDGPPGIGCPVIASVTGADLVLIVTEPTVSGKHDLDRVLALTSHFRIPASVCVNKWDVNPEMATRIEERAAAAGARVVSRIRFDRNVTAAQMAGLALVETAAPAAEDLRRLWAQLNV
jgi:MinD superfamily P-loop ATPase